MSDTLSAAERAAFVTLLDTLSDRLGSAGCNDFDMPPLDIDGAEQFRKDVAAWADEDDPAGAPREPSDIEMDFVVLAYLRDKLGLRGEQ